MAWNILEASIFDQHRTARHPDEGPVGEEFMSSESLLGKWVDSQVGLAVAALLGQLCRDLDGKNSMVESFGNGQGHSIHVLSTDAYNVRLPAAPDFREV